MDDLNPFAVAENPSAFTPPPAAPQSAPQPKEPSPFDVAENPKAHWAENIKKARLNSEVPWERVADELKSNGVDPEEHRQDYQLATARKVQQGEGVGTLEQFGRTSIPFASSIINLRKSKSYTESVDRFKQGKATEEDAGTIARIDRLQQIDQKTGSTFGGKLVQAAGQAPAILGENYGAGKVLGVGGKALGIGQTAATTTRGAAGRFLGQRAAATPLMPSMYLNQMTQKNISEGRQADDIRGLPPALALGVANNVVLGTLQGKVTGPGTLLGQSIKKGAIGAGEQAGVDVLAGAVDELLPKAYKTDTRYGTIGHLARGEYGEGLQHAAVQTLTFSAFAAMHGKSPQPVLDTFKKAIDSGKTPDQAMSQLDAVHQTILDEITHNPNASPESIKEAVSDLPDGPLKEHAHAIADSVPKGDQQGIPIVSTSESRPPEQQSAVPTPVESTPSVSEHTPTPVSRRDRIAALARFKAADIPAEVLPEVIRDAGLQDVVSGMHTRALQQVSPGQEAAVLKYGDRFVSMNYDAFNKRVKLGFGRESGDASQEVAPAAKALPTGETVSMLRGLRSLAGSLKKGGIGIDYQAEPKRARIYEKALTEAGFTKTEQNTRPDGVTEYSWSPSVTDKNPPKTINRPLSTDNFRQNTDIAPKTAPQTSAVESAPATPRQSLMERMRAKQAARPDVQAPPTAAPVTPTAPKQAIPRPAAIAKARDQLGKVALQAQIRRSNAIERVMPEETVKASTDPREDLRHRVLGSRLGRFKDAMKSGDPDEIDRTAESIHELATLRGTTVEKMLADSPEATRELTLLHVERLHPEGTKPTEAELKQAQSDLERSIEADVKHAKRQGADEAATRLGIERNLRESVEAASPTATHPEPRPEAQSAKAKLPPAQKLKLVAKPLSLQMVIADLGGIHPKDAEFLSHFSSVGEAREYGINRPGVFKNTGRGLDQLAQELTTLGHIPEGAGVNGLVERLKEKVPSAHAERTDEYEQRLADYHKAEQEYHDALEEARKEHTPSEIAEAEAGSDQDAHDAFSRHARGEPETSGDDEFAFGANQPEHPPAGATGQAEVQPSQASGAGGADRPAVSSAEHLLQEKLSAARPEHDVSTAQPFNPNAPPPRPPTRIEHIKQRVSDALAAIQNTQHIKESAERMVEYIRDFARKLAGATAPRTSRLSEDTGDAIARVGSSRVYAGEIAPQMLEKVVGSNSTSSFRMLVGGVITEMRLRHMREYFFGQAKQESNAGVAHKALGNHAEAAKHFNEADRYGKLARGVGTIIGGKTPDAYLKNPLESEMSFQQAMNDPEVKKAITNYKWSVVPMLEKYYKKAQGIDEADPINSPTQIPDMPISLWRADSPDMVNQTTVQHTGGGRGNLYNVKARRLGQSVGATGESTHGYNIDIGDIITKTLTDRIPLADKAELYRVAQRENVGDFRVPGDAPVTPEGERYKHIPGVNPPRGTQNAERGETSFYVHPEAESEFRQVLGVEKPVPQLPLVSGSTWASLVSTVETASHLKNQGTMYFRPGMNPVETMKAIKGLLLNDPAIGREIAELARIGAMREHGADTGGGHNGLLWGGKTDPTYWSGRILTVMDRAMRITANRAFDSLIRRGIDIKNTEANRRDFVNQMGNYNKATQSRLVQVLRDTGIGPFATAATNFYMHGLRTILFRSGLQTNSWKASLNLHAEMLARVITLPAIAATMNYLAWGRVDGDENTPIGGLKVGTSENKGKTQYLDMMGLSGFSRGLRETGLLALGEGARPAAVKKGSSFKSATGNAIKDIAVSALHPATGPAFTFMNTLLTGKSLYGQQLATPAKGSDNQQWNNAAAAMWGLNPLMEHWLKPIIDEEMGTTPKNEKTPGERAWKLLGPFGVKSSGRPPGTPVR